MTTTATKTLSLRRAERILREAGHGYRLRVIGPIALRLELEEASEHVRRACDRLVESAERLAAHG